MVDHMKKEIMVIVFSFFSFLLFAQIILSADITITKHLSTNSIKYRSGEIVEVYLDITNNKNENIEGTLTDSFPRYAGIVGKEYDRLSLVPVVSWNVSIDAGKTQTLSYGLNISDVPLSPEGFLNATLAPAFLDINSVKYQSNSAWIYISDVPKPKEKCNYNFVCEPELGETPEICPQDCSTIQNQPPSEIPWLYIGIIVVLVAIPIIYYIRKNYRIQL